MCVYFLQVHVEHKCLICFVYLSTWCHKSFYLSGNESAHDFSVLGTGKRLNATTEKQAYQIGKYEIIMYHKMIDE